MKNKKTETESSEQALEKLIKEAGEEARSRKKKAMDAHAKKLYHAIHDRVTANRRAESA